MEFEALCEQKLSKKITVKDFEQLKVLGKGSYAKVTLVRRIKTGEIFAMKILKKDYIKKKKQEEHTITERNILVEVDHPFIIHLKFSFQTEKKLFFVLEFCQGGELFSLLGKHQRFTEEVTRFYSAQIILAIEYLHSLNIIYRDLKPENVLLDRTGYIRLADFGLSKRNILENNAMSVCGTPEYLAPEILLKQGHGKAVDWWTLGCLIYELIIGVPPYYLDDRKQLFENIKSKPISFPKGRISESLGDLLLRLFDKNPNTRLGANGAQEVKNHPWFRNTDWDSLLQKKVKVPFIPRIKNEYDVSNFDEEFTQAEINSMQEDSMTEKGVQQYYDFSYAGDQLSPSGPVGMQGNANQIDNFQLNGQGNQNAQFQLTDQNGQTMNFQQQQYQNNVVNQQVAQVNPDQMICE